MDPLTTELAEKPGEARVPMPRDQTSADECPLNPRNELEPEGDYTDEDFWIAFPPDELETLPEEGDFWFELEG